MPKLIEKVKQAAGRMAYAARLQLEFFRERLENFLNVRPVDPELVYTYEERELMGQSALLLRQFFPGSPGEALLEEDFESRCDALESFAEKLIGLYGLQGFEVAVSDDPELFPPEKELLFGVTQMGLGKIYLNANLVQLDQEEVLSHLVSTVIHELRHAMQFEAMLLVNTRGVPYSRRKAWRFNQLNYIDSALDPEGYFKQPLEFDARNFSNRIWLEAYQSHIPLGGF